jgi:hypothetical protein
MKSNLVTARAFSIKTSQKGFNIQNAEVFDHGKIITCAIPSSFVPFSEYGKVTDKFGEEHLLQSYSSGNYHSKTGIITQAFSDTIEIPEDTILIGFLRRPNENYDFMRFIPIVGLFNNNEEYAMYEFATKSYNEIYSKNLLRLGFEDYNMIKTLVLRDYCNKFNKVYKNPSISDKWLSKEELENNGIINLKNWQIKLI